MQFLILALALTPAAAAEPAPSLQAELAPLGFLVGSCWQASFPGGRATDVHCFTAPMGGHFVRDRHVVAGAPAPYWGETLYRWDPAARAVHYDYYASDGSHSGGTAEPVTGGLSFHDNHVEADGTAFPIRSSWMRSGENGYAAITEIQRDGQWREHLRMSFTRVSAAPAEPSP